MVLKLLLYISLTVFFMHHLLILRLKVLMFYIKFIYRSWMTSRLRRSAQCWQQLMTWWRAMGWRGLRAEAWTQAGTRWVRRRGRVAARGRGSVHSRSGTHCIGAGNRTGTASNWRSQILCETCSDSKWLNICPQKYDTPFKPYSWYDKCLPKINYCYIWLLDPIYDWHGTELDPSYIPK